MAFKRGPVQTVDGLNVAAALQQSVGLSRAVSPLHMRLGLSRTTEILCLLFAERGDEIQRQLRVMPAVVLAIAEADSA